MYKTIIINPEAAVPAHEIKMVEWRTGQTWTEMSVTPGTAIPQRSTLTLDPNKIKAAQEQSAKILRDFGR